MSCLCVISLILLGSPQTLEERLQQPYVDLILQPTKYPGRDFQSLRSGIERERDQQIDEAKAREKQWKEQLKTARKELEKLNRISSFDAPGAAGYRQDLHREIAALERQLLENSRALEQTIPQEFSTQLSKLWLIEHWPERRTEIADRIEQGRARDRQHGDVEDIGYRVIASEPEKDIEVGQQAARQAAGSGLLAFELQDADVQGYVRRLGARIAANSDLKVPLQLTVLESADVKAISLPGGFLYVTSGVIRATRNESELAGVLSREIAHIAARHGTRTSKGQWISRMFVPVAQVVAGFFTGGVSPGAYYGIGYGLQGLGGVVNHVADGKNEKHQKEADQLGMQYAWKAGFDPRGFLHFLESRREEEPPPGDRLLEMFSELEYLPSRESPVVDSAEFQRIKLRVSPRA